MISDKRALQLRNGVFHLAHPVFLTQAIQSRLTEPFFNDLVSAIGQIAQLEREQRFLPDECRAESGAESEKKHAAAVITSKRLHGRVVDYVHRFAERFCKIKSYPAFAKMFRFPGDAAAADWRRKSNRDRSNAPTEHASLDLRDHFFRSHVWSAIKFCLDRCLHGA